MEEKDIMLVIESLAWKFAKTMPTMPHWYTVRVTDDDHLNGLYEQLYHYIKGNHYVKVFKGRKYKYCDIGEYSYWIMSDYLYNSKIINRALKE